MEICATHGKYVSETMDKILFSYTHYQTKMAHINRNVQVGDVVLVQDSNTIHGQWKLGQICEAIQGMDGRVRDVKIRYKNIGAGRNYC